MANNTSYVLALKELPFSWEDLAMFLYGKVDGYLNENDQIFKIETVAKKIFKELSRKEAKITKKELSKIYRSCTDPDPTLFINSFGIINNVEQIRFSKFIKNKELSDFFKRIKFKKLYMVNLDGESELDLFLELESNFDNVDHLLIYN